MRFQVGPLPGRELKSEVDAEPVEVSGDLLVQPPGRDAEQSCDVLAIKARTPLTG